MPTIRFVGKISPPPPVHLFSDVIPFSIWEMPDIGPVKITLVIKQSIVQIICELAHYEDAYLPALFKHALAFARCCVDMASFATGLGCMLVIDGVQKPDGRVEALLFTHPYLADKCTAYRMAGTTEGDKQNFSEMINLIARDPALFLALNDLVSSLTNTDLAAINCGRVLDGLRKIVAPSLDAKNGWPVLRMIVNADEKYMQWVSDLSTNPRHGDRSWIGSAIVEAVTRTWIVFNRFLEYRKRGNQSLPLGDFPMLVG